MAYQLESFANFTNALEEVGLLTTFAGESEQNPNQYSALNKSALLLLTAKFEVFVEDTVREYIEEINAMRITNLLISKQLKINHSITRIKEIVEVIENPKKDERKVEVFKELAQLWTDQEVIFEDLNIPNRFNYGKHGSKEMQRLFSNIEIEDIFDTIVLYSDNEHSLLDGEQQIDFKAIFNNITNLRNVITHQDKTPNLTHKQIEGYMECLQAFSKKLCEFLEEKLSGLKQEYETYKEVASYSDTTS